MIDCKHNSNVVIVVTGLTASGKSDLAVSIAKEINAEIISADSMQIYHGLAIATAAIPHEERQGIVHHLLGFIEPTERFSVADFQREATKLIREIIGRGKRVVICGGTGQYINSLLDGLIFADPAVDLDLRSELTQRIESEGRENWYDRLCTLDPEAATRIPLGNLKRIVRFFELYELCGLTQTEINRRSKAKGPDFIFDSYCLLPGREFINERINRRVPLLFERGLISEVMSYKELYPEYDTLQASRAIGVKEALLHLNGDLSESECMELIAQNTRRYAKRQSTWFRARKDLIFINENDLVDLSI